VGGNDYGIFSGIRLEFFKRLKKVLQKFIQSSDRVSIGGPYQTQPAVAPEH